MIDDLEGVRETKRHTTHEVLTRREKSGRRKSQWERQKEKNSPYNFNVANDEDGDDGAPGGKKKPPRTSGNGTANQKLRRASSLSSVANFMGARRKVTQRAYITHVPPHNAPSPPSHPPPSRLPLPPTHHTRIPHAFPP